MVIKEKELLFQIEANKNLITQLNKNIDELEGELKTLRSKTAEEIVMTYLDAKEVILNNKDTEKYLNKINEWNKISSDFDSKKESVVSIPNDPSKYHTYNITINTNGCETSSHEIAEKFIKAIKEKGGGSL